MKELFLNSAINHLKNSPVLQSAVAIADDYMNKLNTSFSRDPIDLQQLLEKLSPATDDLIVGFERDEGLTFIGGELAVFLPVQKTEDFSVQLKLYFNNKQEKIILKEVNKNLSLKVLTKKSVDELVSKNRLEYQVDAPKIVKNK